jgi:hypothetical protein
MEERNCTIPVEGTSIVVADQMTTEKPRKKVKSTDKGHSQKEKDNQDATSII